MENNKQLELLTANLYNKVTSDKTSEITSLKEKELSVLKKIKEELENLNNLKEQKRQLNNKIRFSKRFLKRYKKDKYRLIKEMNKQQDLVVDLNELILEDEVYVNVDSFYPELEETKKR